MSTVTVFIVYRIKIMLMLAKFVQYRYVTFQSHFCVHAKKIQFTLFTRFLVFAQGFRVKLSISIFIEYTYSMVR